MLSSPKDADELTPQEVAVSGVHDSGETTTK